MQEQNPIVLMNFSGIYREEEFWKNRQVSWIELQDVCGTNCYCDEEAIAEINKRTENYPTVGIHFIDSGNYHYMTRLWLTRMDQPFCLLVYDNHTDMQPPAFGGILSCGGWIAAALEELENLKYVILVNKDFKRILTEEKIREIVGLVPDDWLHWNDSPGTPQEIRDVYIRFLIDRIAHSDTFINEARHARQTLI